MRRVWMLPVLSVTLLALNANIPANAVSADRLTNNPAVAGSNIHFARAFVRGPNGGRAVVGPRGMAVRGPNGGAVVHGRYRVGGRYYGGVWYGTGRRYWRGRWWAYGVGSCWRSSPVGFVWVCGT